MKGEKITYLGISIYGSVLGTDYVSTKEYIEARSKLDDCVIRLTSMEEIKFISTIPHSVFSIFDRNRYTGIYWTSDNKKNGLDVYCYSYRTKGTCETRSDVHFLYNAIYVIDL